jgi:hypothetical protein
MRLSLRLPAPSPARSFAVFSGLIAALLLPVARPARAQYGQPPAATYSAPAFSGGQWFSSYYQPGTPHPYGSGGNTTGTGDSSMQVNSTGTVTAAFTWSDAGNPADPAPPCVIEQTGYAEWYGVPPFTSSPSCGDGLGDPEVGSSSGQTLQGRSSGTRYGLGVPSSGVISVSLTGAQANVRPTGVDSGMFGSSVNWAVTAYPIVLSSPDPLGRPDLGDGKNQFVYNGYATGQLLIPARITALGAGAAQFSWLTVGHHVDISVIGPAISGEKPYTWYPSSSDIEAQTSGVDAASQAYPLGDLAFLGLPTMYNGSTGDPNAFGNHLAVLKVDGNNSQSAHIQTFFTGTASNRPGSDGITPNWYYYYSQVEPASGLYDSDAVDSWTEPGIKNNYAIHVGSSAYVSGPASGMRVFYLRDTQPTTLIQYAGDLFLKGIHHFIEENAHESGHRNLFLGTYGTAYTEGTFVGPGPQNWSWPLTSDGDNVINSWEISHHLDPNSPDTTQAYPSAAMTNGDVGDNEVIADIQALAPVFNDMDDWQKDWAAEPAHVPNGGLQYGSYDYKTATPAGFHWSFYARMDSTASGSPSNGQPAFVHGNTYQIRSLADLQAQYPGVPNTQSSGILTSISQLGP